jgi:DNA replication protein DnaC
MKPDATIPVPKADCPDCRGSGLLFGVDAGKARVQVCPCGGVCPRCGDSGRLLIEAEGVRRVARCRCRLPHDRADHFNAAGLPGRHAHSSFVSFDTNVPGARQGFYQAQGWANGDQPRGLILFGEVGRGKTHLLAGALRTLVFEKGLRARFVEFSLLLADLKRGFETGRRTSSLVAEALDTDVLAIDELGKGRNTEWELTVLDELVSRAYNDQKVLIATTNYRPGEATGAGPGNLALVGTEGSTPQTLGDRVGNRVFSRLCEMCDFVEVGRGGQDFRLLQARGMRP